MAEGIARPESNRKKSRVGIGSSAASLVLAVGVLDSSALFGQVVSGPALDQKPAAGSPAQGRAIPQGLNFANALLNERRYELAVEEFEKYLRTRPAPRDEAEAQYGLGRALLSLKRYAEARTHFESFLTLAPESPQAATARFRLAESAYLGRDMPDAKRLFEDYLARYPGHVHRDAAWPYLGDVRFGLGDMAGARAAYETTISEFPNGPLTDRARFFLARVLAAQKDVDPAVAQLRSLADRTSSEWADRAKLQIPQVLIGAGRFDAALAEMDALEKAQPTLAVSGGMALKRADALAGLKRTGEAEAVLKDLIAKPGIPDAVAAQAGYTLGQMAWEKGQYPQALAAWEAAQARGPSPALAPMLLFRTAEALSKTGQPEAARARFQRLADLYAGDAWADQALVQAAQLSLEAEDLASASAAADRVLKDYPRSSLRPNARLISARAAQLGGKTPQAIAAFEQLLEADKPNPETAQAALFYLSQAYKTAGQPEKAAQVLTRIAGGQGMTLAGNARYALGQGHFDAARYTEAVAALEPYVRENPKNPLTPHALAYLVLAHDALKQPADAQARLDELARDWPESEDLLRVRMRLGEQALDAREYARAVELLTAAADQKLAADEGKGETPEAWTARARVGLGWALLGQDKPERAAESFGRALDARPAPSAELSAEAAYMQGFAWEKAGQADRALEAYAGAAATYKETPQGLNAALARARLLGRTGRAAEAAEALGALLLTRPAGLEEKASLATLLAELARVQENAGQADAAELTYQKLIKEYGTSPEAAEARIALAEQAAKQKRFADARGWLEPIANPVDGTAIDAALRDRALFRLGRMALDDGKTEDAATQFKRVIDGNGPASSRDLARFWHAEALYRGDHPSEAEPEFAELARDRSAGVAVEAWRDTARLRHIQCLVSLRKWPDVLTEADAFLADRPEFPQRSELHIARGRALQSQALPRFEDARAAFAKAQELAPGTESAARAAFFTGEAYLHEKNYREAVKSFHQVELLYKLPRLQADALLEAGTCYAEMGQKTQSADAYRKIISDFAEQPAATEARKRLDAINLAPANATP